MVTIAEKIAVLGSLLTGGCFALLAIWRSQALFEVGIVGIDFSSAVVFVKIEFCDFLLLLGVSFS